MTTAVLRGQTTWSMRRDEDSHRTYKITFRVRGLSTDGPANVLQTPGLPLYGSTWIVDNDVDIWAWCRWDADVQPAIDGEPNTEWLVTFTFSTKPPNCCRQSQIEDPLLEPMVISGGNNKYTEEGTVDRFGDPILNSALEQIRGPQNEWDANRATIKIQQNVPDLEFALCQSMVNCVNDENLWGFPPGGVKLSSFNWERKFYGSCNVYYTRTFEFETNSKTWDRDVLDEGTKALNGHHHPTSGAWVLDDINGAPPDPANPLHFRRYKDRAGENTTVILDGAGKPFIPPDPPAAVKWWAIPCFPDDSGLGGPQPPTKEFQGTCEQARARASSYGCRVLGPYDSRDEVRDISYNLALNASELDCPDDSAPGKNHIEYYADANFLLLGIPTEF